MEDRFLIISDNYSIQYEDGVFCGYSPTTNKDNFIKKCEENAKEWRTSDLGNFDGWSKEDREKVAQLWDKVASMKPGTYNYYFNLEDKEDIFMAYVKEKAKMLGISFEYSITHIEPPHIEPQKNEKN